MTSAFAGKCEARERPGAEPDTIDWDAALEGVTHLHLSGISPALGPRTTALALAAARAARVRGLTLIFDGN